MVHAWSRYLESSEPAAVASAATNLATENDLVAVLVGERDADGLDALVAALGDTDVDFFGGVFPELLVGRQRFSSGVLLLRLPGLGAPVVIRDLGRASADLGPVSALLANAGDQSPPTAFVLVDGLTPMISRCLEAIYDICGMRVRYWGGGAGVSSLAPGPCLFTRTGAFDHGAIVALSSLASRLAVHHGWHELRGPLVATRTEGNVIRQLNWRSALEVYRTHVAEDLGIDPAAAELWDHTRAYPLGIQRQGAEVIVRDPVDWDASGGLVCVGDVPVNAVLSVLKGDPESLVAAAHAAAREAASQGSDPIRHCLIADCVSRVWFLEGRFQDEIDAIERGLGGGGERGALCGVLTLGEISSRGDQYLEFFNKTCVVAVLHERP